MKRGKLRKTSPPHRKQKDGHTKHDEFNICFVPPVSSSVIGGSTDVSSPAGPVDVDVLPFWQSLASELRLDTESVGTYSFPSAISTLKPHQLNANSPK